MQPSVDELGGAAILGTSGKRTLGASDQFNANELGATIDPGDMFDHEVTAEDALAAGRTPEPAKPKVVLVTFVESAFGGMSGGAVESKFEPSFVGPAIEDMPGGAAESKFEPGVTVEPKVDVIPGAATQGNTHPADRPSDTAKRKTARERQGRGGRPDPGARKGDATVGRSARRTARRGGYQALSCLARGRS